MLITRPPPSAWFVFTLTSAVFCVNFLIHALSDAIVDPLKQAWYIFICKLTSVGVNTGAQCSAEDGARILGLGEHCTTEPPSLPLHKNSVNSRALQLCRQLTTDAHFCPLLTLSIPVYLGVVSRTPPMPCRGCGAFLAQSHVWFLSCMGTGCVAKLWTFHCLGKSQSPAGGLFPTAPSTLPRCCHLYNRDNPSSPVTGSDKGQIRGCGACLALCEYCEGPGGA